MNQTESPTSPADREISRRRSPRIEVLGQLHGQVVPMDVPLLVRNLGAGGFGVESSIPFPAGAIHRFRFTTVTGVGIVVSAEVRHCYVVKTLAGATRHRAGFAFVHEPGGLTLRAIEVLLGAATSALTFE